MAKPKNEKDIVQPSQTEPQVDQEIADIADEAEAMPRAVSVSAVKRGEQGAITNYLAQAGYQVAKHVTLPVFRIAETPSILRIDTAFKQGAVLEKAKIKTPPMMANATDMSTGTCGQIIAGAVLYSELTGQYPEHSYVGKVFSIAKLSPNGKRDYSLYSIIELLPL